MIVLNKVFKFCAAHKYHNPAFSKEQNLAVFGDDTRVHGHNYTLTVSVTGEVDPATGFLVDLGHLKQLVQERVISRVDHAMIDTDIDWFTDKQPSTENLVVWIWNQLEPHLKSGKLQRIRLEETPTIFTDYFGPDA